MDRVFPTIIDSIVFPTVKPAIAFPLFAHRPEALVAHRPRPQMRRLRCDDDDDDDPRMWVALSPLRRQSQAATSSHRSTPRRSHVENSRSRSRGRQRGASFRDCSRLFCLLST